MDLIASLIPDPQTSTANDDDDEDIDSETSELARKTSLVLLRLTYTRARARLESIAQEAQLLRSIPPPPSQQPSDDQRTESRKAEEDMWKLDQPLSSGGPDGRGPLMDSSGRPLRPFTILPSGASADRARLQGQVFRPDHRLPTMTIDEYLEIEQERGNIISGGGKASEDALTSSEQLNLDAEQDGTIMGDLKEEERRQKDENWAQFTDANPYGAGNTMNRG
jgi:immunoglobulin-binding protein 1